MSPFISPQAQMIEALAKFMEIGKLSYCCKRIPTEFPTICSGCHEHATFSFGDWNPTTDWNHWRQVEEKVMEDEELLVKYMSALYEQSDKTEHVEYVLLKATLQERCEAAYSILSKKL